MKPIDDNIPVFLFKSKMKAGFGLRKYGEQGQTDEEGEKIELHDIMLALTLLSRIPNDKKLELIFKLTDVDEDDCLSPQEINKMIQVIERIFAKENSDMVISSRVLLEEHSRSKANRKFELFMKIFTNSKTRSENEEVLITLDEFKKTLDEAEALKKDFLPRFIDLKSVLRYRNTEPVINLCEEHLDEFLTFRWGIRLISSGEYENSKEKEKKKDKEKEKEKFPQIKKTTKVGKPSYYKKKFCPGLINNGKSSNVAIKDDCWELSTGNIYTSEAQEKKSNAKQLVDKNLERPVEKALNEMKKEKEKRNGEKGPLQNNKNDDDENPECNSLVEKVKGHVMDTEKKINEMKQIEIFDRKSGFKS
jgi:hypothetical protein